jgi:nucleotide-binding universal stress UspA family protein
MKHRAPVMVALDGTPDSERAILVAADLARGSQTGMQLVQVDELTPALRRSPNSDTAFAVLARVETQSRVSELAERWTSRGIPTVAVLLEGTVESTLLNHIAQVHPECVVMASRGPKGALRSRPGSLTDRVLRASVAPVIVVPGDDRQVLPRPIKRVLVALDGSPISESVLPAIIDLCRAANAVFLVTVTPETRLDLRQLYLEAIAERLRAHGLQVRSIVRESTQPAATIVLESIRHQVDLIAVSTHSANQLSRFAVGSCTDSILALSTLPVLAVNPSLTYPMRLDPLITREADAVAHA